MDRELEEEIGLDAERILPFNDIQLSILLFVLVLNLLLLPWVNGIRELEIDLAEVSAARPTGPAPPRPGVATLIVRDGPGGAAVEIDGETLPLDALEKALERLGKGTSLLEVVPRKDLAARSLLSVLKVARDSGRFQEIRVAYREVTP